MVFNSNALITVTEREADGTGTTLYDHVFENKGRKITVKLKLDDSSSEPALPAKPKSQLEPSPKRHNETRTTQEPQCEQQSESRAKPYVEPQPEKEEDALQPKSQSERQPEPLCGSESTSGPVLPAEHEPPSPPRRHAETQTEPGSRCEEQSKPQSVPSSEAQSGIKEAQQPKLQPETHTNPLHEQLKTAAEEAEKIESIRDRLGASVTYLKGLLEIGDVVKDVSCSSQNRPPTDHKHSRRSIHSLAFP